ncbi:hypothetical protein Tco_0894422 [Tanacetum coccineum]|uniref:Uncharacterized protein n=1 Tax=Tanacetum coccineum TaxID=301880 RepID=A0ABQ5CC34_9ASTR
MAEQDTPPPTITSMKIPIIKKGEYDIWCMRMRQYICHTDHNLWDIIIDGDLQEEATPAGDQPGPPAPKTAQQLTVKMNQERAAIKSRFRGNDESKKMQRNVLKQQFENFTTTQNESLDKAYDRLQKLISQLEVHAAPVSKEDINQKFLRSLPPSWSQIALIMRNKPDIDQTDIDDLYNNLRVYENEMKRSSSSTSNSQNMAFLSSENTSSTNEVSTASGNFGVNTLEELIHQVRFHLLQQIDQYDLEELDIRWQVAMLTVSVQRFIKNTGRNLDFKGKQHVTFDKSQEECNNKIRYGTQLDEMSNKSETDSEISMSVFEVSSSDEKITPANDEFSKADGYHVVPPPITRNFLTPKADISFTGLDEYAIRKKIIESKTTKPKDNTSESKTSETVGKINEVEKSKTKINRDKVIIEDWNSDDKDDVSEVNTVTLVKTNETQTVKTQVDKIGQISPKEEIEFKKIKACFVYKSTDHLIKDCNFYAKKSSEPKLKIVVNIGQRVVKPVWDNAKRVNHQKFSNKLKYPQVKRTFFPSRVLTRTCLVNPVRPNRKRAVHTVSIARPISTARPFAPK